jgi:hypothetical protein
MEHCANTEFSWWLIRKELFSLADNVIKITSALLTTHETNTSAVSFLSSGKVSEQRRCVAIVICRQPETSDNSDTQITV